MPVRKSLGMAARVGGWLLAITSSLPAADGAAILPPAGTPAAAIGLQLAPDTTVITTPLNDAGYPDYVAALNEQLSAGVSRDENFWVLMWPAIGNAERTGEGYISEVERRLGITIPREPQLRDPLADSGLKYGTPAGDQLQKEWDEAMTRPWTRDEFPSIARWVDAHSEPLSQIHEACLRPKAYAPLIAGEGGFPMVAVLLPHVQACRSAARLLVCRSMLRLGEGDVAGSWQDLTDLYRLAGHCERGVTLIEALVGYACRAIAQRPMTCWISTAGLSAEDLQEHLAEIEPLLLTESLARKFDCERYMYLDTVLAMATGRTNSREMLGLVESAPPSSDESMDDLRKMRQVMFQLLFLGSDVNETLRYGNALYDDMFAAVAPTNPQERKALLAKVEARVQQDSRIAQDGGALVRTYLFGSRRDVQQMPARMMAGLLLPAVTSVERAQTRMEANAKVLRAAFAAQRHLLRTGEVPTTISILDPDGSLDLSDPFTGAPLRTVVDDRGLVIYSVGINGIDDNGRTYGDEPSGADDLRAVLTSIP